MAMPWTLTHHDVTRTLAEWGLQHAVITEQSLTAGIFSVSMPGNMQATLPWAYEDVITLKLDDVVKFKGVVLNARRSDDGFSQGVSLRFADPWWYLSQGTFVQPWWVKASGTAYDAPRCALFAGITPGEGWVKRTIAEDIADIIAQCNAYHGGEVMQLGELRGDGFSAKPIPQRVNNVTYESVLRQVLAWVPDAIQQWDYSTTPPTLSFVQRAAATVRTYSRAANGVQVSSDFIRRDDMALRGIQITYAGLDAFGFVTKVFDEAGETTGTRILKTVIDCTGNGSGAAATTPISTPAITRDYTVVSEAIDPTSADFWFRYGGTGAQSAADIVVGTGSGMELAAGAPENAGKSDLGGCDLQWLEGGIPRSRLSANTRVALVTGYLTIRTTTTEESSAAPITITEKQERRVIRLLVPVTKLSGEYTQVIQEASTTIGNGIPQLLSPIFLTPGLAAKLLAAWGPAQYDGSLKLVQAECDEPVILGDVVNVTGGLAEWATMATQVHSLTREIDTGTTSIQTGVAEHLGVTEYASMLRMSRLRTVPAMDLDSQATGQVPAPDPDHDEDELDDLVGPGALKSSVLHGQQKTTTTTASGVHTVDMTAEDGPTITTKDTASGDEVVTTPGKQTVKNEGSEKSNTATPSKQSIKSGEHDSAELSAADGVTLATETKTAQLSATNGLNLTGESGEIITLSIAEGLLMITDGFTVQLKPGLGLVLSDGTKTTIVDLLRLLHNNGAGKTNLVSDEQIVVNDGSEMTVIEAGETTVQNGTGDSMSIKPAELRTTDGGGNYSSVSAEGGFQNNYGGAKAKLFVGSVKLEEGSGIVNIYTVSGQTIDFKDTEGCDVDDAGEPIDTTAKVLRGAATAA